MHELILSKKYTINDFLDPELFGKEKLKKSKPKQLVELEKSKTKRNKELYNYIMSDKNKFYLILDVQILIIVFTNMKNISLSDAILITNGFSSFTERIYVHDGCEENELPDYLLRIEKKLIQTSSKKNIEYFYKIYNFLCNNCIEIINFQNMGTYSKERDLFCSIL